MRGMTEGFCLRGSGGTRLRRDRSLPPAVRGTGRRSVGNRKERLRDYAGFPGPRLRRGQRTKGGISTSLPPSSGLHHPPSNDQG